MLRVRLKADGRLVEVLPDGSERAIASDPRAIATAAHDAARAAEQVATPLMTAISSAAPVSPSRFAARWGFGSKPCAIGSRASARRAGRRARFSRSSRKRPRPPSPCSAKGAYSRPGFKFRSTAFTGIALRNRDASTGRPRLSPKMGRSDTFSDWTKHPHRGQRRQNPAGRARHLGTARPHLRPGRRAGVAACLSPHRHRRFQ